MYLESKEKSKKVHGVKEEIIREYVPPAFSLPTTKKHLNSTFFHSMKTLKFYFISPSVRYCIILPASPWAKTGNTGQVSVTFINSIGELHTHKHTVGQSGTETSSGRSNGCLKWIVRVINSTFTLVFESLMCVLDKKVKADLFNPSDCSCLPWWSVCSPICLSY